MANEAADAVHSCGGTLPSDQESEDNPDWPGVATGQLGGSSAG